MIQIEMIKTDRMPSSRCLVWVLGVFGILICFVFRYSKLEFTSNVHSQYTIRLYLIFAGFLIRARPMSNS
jgi:hypothetical protein